MTATRETLDFQTGNYKDFQNPVRFQSNLGPIPQSPTNGMQSYQGQIYPIQSQPPKPEIGKDMVKPPYSYIALIAMAINRFVIKTNSLLLPYIK